MKLNIRMAGGKLGSQNVLYKNKYSRDTVEKKSILEELINSVIDHSPELACGSSGPKVGLETNRTNLTYSRKKRENLVPTTEHLAAVPLEVSPHLEARYMDIR